MEKCAKMASVNVEHHLPVLVCQPVHFVILLITFANVLQRLHLVLEMLQEPTVIPQIMSVNVLRLLTVAP